MGDIEKNEKKDSPKSEPKYNGKVYVIRSHQTDKIYIGSSTQKYLSNRLACHKQDYKNYLNGKGNNVSSYEIVKYPDAYIEILSTYENITKDELRKFEGEAIRNNICVNKCIAGRTTKEYREFNKDKIQKYRDEHKDRKRELNKQWREKNKDYHKNYYQTKKLKNKSDEK